MEKMSIRFQLLNKWIIDCGFHRVSSFHPIQCQSDIFHMYNLGPQYIHWFISYTKAINYIGASSNETVTREELKSLIYSDETRTQFSEFIQSTIKPRYDTLSRNGTEESIPVDSNRFYDNRKRKRRASTYDAETDDTWICATINVPTLLQRYVGIARLKHATNFGPTREGISLIFS